jgi:tRNA threonylcarbamoyladenosine biosynthesis protein TsaB
MQLLAFDTSTEFLSIAVQRSVDGTLRTWQQQGPGGAQASASLIPHIQSLMDQAGLRFEALDALVFGAGPGSFTGLRTACSVAQGLALGASARRAAAGLPGDIPVLPVSSLLAVAEKARHLQGAHQVVAALDARMDEVYSASFAWDGQTWRQTEAERLLAPEQLQVPPGWCLAGNAQTVYADRLILPSDVPGVVALPQATAMLRLAPALLAAGHAVPADRAMPRYIRDKVAKTTSERAAEKAAL